MEQDIKQQLIQSVNSIQTKIKNMKNEENQTDLTMSRLLKPITVPIKALVENSYDSNKKIYRNKNTGKVNLLHNTTSSSEQFQDLSLENTFIEEKDADANDSFETSASYEEDRAMEKLGGNLTKFKSYRSNTDLVYWDDPNELIERLQLLIASKDAGNTNHDNENLRKGKRRKKESLLPPLKNGESKKENTEKTSKKRDGTTKLKKENQVKAATQLESRPSTSLKTTAKDIMGVDSDIDEDLLNNVMERLVHKQLSDFLVQNNLMNQYQSGFRPGHSTVTALIKITDDIRLGMENGAMEKLGGNLTKFKSYRSNTDLVYWDDPNELIERLQLLIASKDAGNTNHDNEILSIIEELKEAGIIKE
ncbi:unnamed protein product [Plutella xylostella]|uniref:(diamondback moth) hypothetical protein n=1 Tax=Plutella xylostella TaxID=51655 RepID=A0A8S4FMA1_PLUXY|nr:unnamed protein product [Plutella xylostella]